MWYRVPNPLDDEWFVSLPLSVEICLILAKATRLAPLDRNIR